MIAEVSLSDPQHIVSLFAEGVPPPSDIEDLPKPPISGVRPSHLKDENVTLVLIQYIDMFGSTMSTIFYSEPGFLKLRSPRGQLLAYLCTYLLLSLKR